SLSHLVPRLGVMEPASAVRFATVARVLGTEAARRGLAAPGFRAPPRLAGADRSLRRRPDGGATIAVRVRGRALADVGADMGEGIVAVNRLPAEEAARLRAELGALVALEVGLVAAAPG